MEEFHNDMELKFHKDYTKEFITKSPLKGALNISKAMEKDLHLAFLSNIEVKNFQQAVKEESWIMAMQDKLNQFERNKV